MNTVYVVTISTEDGEEYKYAFYQRPSETKIKGLFYRDNGGNYKRKDWGVNISHNVEELTII